MDFSFEDNEAAAALLSSYFNSHQRLILPHPNGSNPSSSGSDAGQFTTPDKLLLPSKEEWEKVLKPIIQDLYIVKNTTQTRLIDRLKTKYGFKITPKQLTKHLKAWGFAKNTTRSQRIAILNSDGSLEQAGPKITETKKIRWKKERMRRNDHQTICDPEIFMIEAPELDVPVVKVREFDEPPPTEIQEQPDVNMEMESEPFPRPFSWNDVDVRNSPGLTRLFSHLKIECEEEIPEFELPPSSMPLSPTYFENASCCEANNKLSNKTTPSGIGTLEGYTSLSLVTHDSYVCSPHGEPLPHPDFGPPFPNCFSSSLFPSPFNEVYVFPKSPVTKHLIRRGFPFEQLRDWDSKLRHLQRAGLFSLSNSKNLRMTGNFIESCLVSRHKGSARKAEYWCKQLLKSKDCANSDKRFRYKLYLAETIFNQYQWQKAQETIEEVENDLARVGISDDEVSIQSSLLKGQISELTGDYEASQKHYRDSLQQCLNILGPNHDKTLAVMYRLSSPLRSRHPQNEELLRNVIRLGEKNSVTVYGAMLRLARELNKKCQYEEAISLGKKVIEELRGYGTPIGVREKIRKGFKCIIGGLLGRGKVQESIGVAREYTRTDILTWIAMCGKIAKSCRVHQEVEMLVSLLKSCEEKQSLSSIWKPCRQAIKQIRVETGFSNHWVWELENGDHLVKWYQAQKDAEQDRATAFIGEIVILEE